MFLMFLEAKKAPIVIAEEAPIPFNHLKSELWMYKWVHSTLIKVFDQILQEPAIFEGCTMFSCVYRVPNLPNLQVSDVQVLLNLNFVAGLFLQNCPNQASSNDSG